jgi:CHAT domain-containing protein
MGVTSWNTLPGTAFEISEIKKMIPAAEIMAQSDANEKKIKDFSASGALQNYRIIHFAAHGVVLPALPSLSAVVLSQINNPANSEDGYLTMKEIAKLKLRSDLVNLSACETGLGKLYGGEGVVGLTQAFQQAGANALSVSLWSVADESTAKFMTGFYNLSLLQNISFSVAATEIKRKFIKGEFGETYKKPFYWAPFVYYGK